MVVASKTVSWPNSERLVNRRKTLSFGIAMRRYFLRCAEPDPSPDEKRDDLLTIDVQTLDPALGLEDLMFEISSYGFTEDIASCKAQVLSLVMAQESRSD